MLRVLIAIALVGTAAVARADDDEAARAHFKVGQSYYDEANYTDALKAFKEALRLTKKPALHYNIALCHERLDQIPEAIASLETYLAEVPAATDRKLVEIRIANLKGRLEQIEQAQKAQREREAQERAQKEQAARAAAQAQAAPAPKRKRVATWVVGATGLALLLGSAVTGGLAQVQFNALSRDCPMDQCNANVQQADIDRGRRLALTTDVLWPIGVAAVGVAVALFFVEGRRPADKPKVTLAPFLSGSGGGLSLVATH
jgi:tetratricopeptide (TPR) repeat protein